MSKITISLKETEETRKRIRDYCNMFEMSTGTRLTTSEFLHMAIIEKLARVEKEVKK